MKNESDLRARVTNRRKFLAAGLAGAVVVGSAAGYYLLRFPDGTYTLTTQSVSSTAPASSEGQNLSSVQDSSSSNPGESGFQLPLLTFDPPHREGSLYFRSDQLQLRLDDGLSYYTLPKVQAFSKGGVVLSPAAQTIVIWRAPFSCTVTGVRAYQDVGSGSVLTAYINQTDLLSTDVAISAAATWQDGGALAKTDVSEGDSIAIKIVSVAGSPNYISVQVEFTRP